MMRSIRSFYVAVLLTIALFSLAAVLVPYYGDWLWFDNLGYASVFTTILAAKAIVFCVFFLIFFLAISVNIAIARRNAPVIQPFAVIRGGEHEGSPLDLLSNERIFKIVSRVVFLLFSCIMGLAAAGSWPLFLKFLHASSFGIADPVFGKDVGFYVFTLPVYQFIQGWYLFAVVLVIAGVSFSYSLSRSTTLGPNGLFIQKKAKNHLAILAGFFFAGIVFLYRLKLYGILYSTMGVAYGASYTDLHALLPAYWALLLITFAVTLMFFFAPFFQRWRVVRYLVVAYLVVLILFTWVYPTTSEAEYFIGIDVVGPKGFSGDLRQYACDSDQTLVYLRGASLPASRAGPDARA